MDYCDTTQQSPSQRRGNNTHRGLDDNYTQKTLSQHEGPDSGQTQTNKPPEFTSHFPRRPVVNPTAPSPDIVTIPAAPINLDSGNPYAIPCEYEMPVANDDTKQPVIENFVLTLCKWLRIICPIADWNSSDLGVALSYTIFLYILMAMIFSFCIWVVYLAHDTEGTPSYYGKGSFLLIKYKFSLMWQKFRLTQYFGMVQQESCI